MLEFHRVAIGDRDLISKYRLLTPRDGLNYLFEVLFLYRNVCEFELAEWRGFLFIKTFVRCNHNFLFPLGTGDLSEAFEVMREYSERHKCPFALYQIREEEKQLLQTIVPNDLKWVATPEEEEYIYEREKLATLQGKALQPKQNHINSLLKTAQCRFEPFTEETLGLAKAFEEEWCRLHFDPADTKTQMEVEAVQEAFLHYEQLGLKGGVLWIDGKVEGFSIGAELNQDTFIVLFEKANHEIRGAYPLLNREFVNTFCGGYNYINREEDGGNAGLRQAKLSYHPLPKRELWSLLK